MRGIGLRFNPIPHIRRVLNLRRVGRRVPVVVITVAGVLFAAVSYRWARINEDDDLRRLFRSEAEAQVGSIRGLLDRHFSKTTALAEFFRGRDHVTAEEFAILASALFSPRIVALEWVPRVLREDRARFEEGIRQTRFPDYHIKDLITPTELVPAPDRAEYFPVALLEPLKTYPRAMGVDMWTRPQAGDALLDAGRSGSLRVSLPTRFIQNGGKHEGVFAFMPVYRIGEPLDTPEQRWRSLRGFVVAACQLGVMLEESLAPFEHAGTPISHRLYLQDALGWYRFVAGAQPPMVNAPGELRPIEIPRIGRGTFQHAVPFAVGGQNWLVICEPKPGTVEAMRTWAPLGIAVLTLAFTWIFAAYCWLLISKTAQVERTVAERTHELNYKNEQLGKENEKRIAARAELAQALRKERQALEAARATQEKLAASEARYRVMGETIPYGVWLTDVQGEPQYFSQSFLDLLGLTVHDTRDLGWTARLAPEEVDATVAKVKAAFASGENLDLENRFLTTDGTFRVVLMRGRPVRDSAGAITSWVGINLDITQRKQGEEELRQHRDYLEELVRSRTLELRIANDELRRDIEQRRKAEEALRGLQESLEEQVKARTAELAATNRELEAFSYSVSHDLRAPLRHVLGFVQLLEKDAKAELGEASRRHLQIITQAATRMGQLIDDLLKFSRLGRAAMRLGPVALGPLIDDVRQELAVGEADPSRVEWAISDELPEVEADTSLLRIVLVNLLSNALKYSRTRTRPRIEIGTYEEKNDEVTFYVRDNGVGFDMKYVDRLFGVFQRLHKAEEFEGTGIGLAIVQRIIHRHGGSIRAEGAIDGGATFYVTLPVAAGVDAKPLEANTAGRR